MANKLSGRVALITGGGSGIGEATARRFSDDGALVVVADRAFERANSVASELGNNSFAVSADVTEEADVQNAVRTAVERFGRLDIAVNAAGIGLSVALIDQTIEQWQSVQDINLAGVFLSCKHQARQMVLQPAGGVIINIVSTNAVQPGEGLSAYCASKAGVAMLTRVAAMELGSRKVRVVGIGPGLTETPLVARLLNIPTARKEFLDNIPAGRPGTPQDIAAVAAFLASDDAQYISGDTIYVDGGSLTQRYPSLASRTPPHAGVPA